VLEEAAMTRAQIIAITRQAIRRVLANRTGVVPMQERHRERLVELKRQRDEQREAELRLPTR
jgi:hypothetical protein